MLNYALFWKFKVKRSYIFFYILLIFLQVQCGSYFIYESLQKEANDKSDLSPLLLLSGGGSTPLNVEPVSWLSFPSSPVIFKAGATGNYSVGIQYPYSGCPTSQTFYIQTATNGVPLDFLSCSNFYFDGCGILNPTICNVSGSTAGNANVIYQIPSYQDTAPFPGVHVNQIIGVVQVQVIP
ncbi:hypothetical protein CH352_18125 [Leptospira hartskeerlii]|uniref:Uncharacterized protein n=1 Tax=Leptospira hartskeerlii TaxID=2023177 RepID=A0A2M9X8F7_9LEPT|nr:hypothetical protein CH357_18275 [Leptospira hartskeerlii]PJZ32046.1 hypothetical protein CH352_18125 [Leptospira hartskeerlii]